MTDYGQEIRELADEYAKLAGEMPFSGVEHRGHANVYMFDRTSFNNGEEALGYMRRRLADVKAAGIYPDHSECVSAEWGSRTHRHEGVKGSWLFPYEV